MRHEWNTGCAYTRHGQRIVAEVMADHIAFVDRDRGIYGTMPMPFLPIMTTAELQDYIMRRYIRNEYDCGRDAHAFADKMHKEMTGR
jgi:hypothetical protein